MGGVGSGRRPSGTRQTVDAALKVDIHAVRRAVRKAHAPACSITWVHGATVTAGVVILMSNRLVVKVGGRTLDACIRYRNARFGGVTASCLCGSCARSCTTLFVGRDGLQCRRCAGLSYDCQRLRTADRAYLKVQKIIARLRGQAGDSAPTRPAGMWRKTYLRRVQQLRQAQRTCYNALRSSR